MRIRTRLILMGLLPLAIGVANVAVILWTDAQTEGVEQNLRITEQMESAISELNLLGNELLKPSKRARVTSQWRQRRESVAAFLRQLEPSGQGALSLLESVRKDFDALDLLFERMVSGWQRLDESGEQGGANVIALNLLLDQVQVRLRGVLDSTTLLHRQQHEQHLDIQAAADTYVFWTAGGSALLGAWLAITMGWRIRSGFRLLQHGTEQVAAGNLTHRINAHAGDELGDLARAFDNMNDRLSVVTASRDDLDLEVSERTRVERALKELNEHLEERVVARTAELRASNAALEAAMAELKATQARLIQQEKLSALGTVVAGVAHELNNPLMGILNYVQYARDRADSEVVRNTLDKAGREVQRITGIVRNMLSFSRSGVSAVSRTDATASVTHALELVDADLRSNGIAVDLDLQEALPAVVATGDALQQVFLNLLINARDAVKNTDQRRLRISSRQEGERVLISVSDSGPGVPPELLRRIFDPFFTTKPPGEGTGLGLSVSQNIVTGFGGTLEYAASPGGGATFTVGLPVA